MAATAQSRAGEVEPERVGRCCDRAGELLCRIADHDHAAYEELYHRYVRPVFALAVRSLRDRGHAEDVVQEVFVAVWRSAHTYDPQRGPGGPWLYAIARNVVIDCVRGCRDAVGPIPDQVSEEPEPAAVAEAGLRAFRVHAAVSELPEGEREVLVLAYWRGRSQSEIADAIGIPLGTVKTRTRSGLRRLAVSLAGQL